MRLKPRKKINSHEDRVPLRQYARWDSFLMKMNVRFAWFAILLLLCSCGSKRDPAKSILPADCQLREGDVVFRKGSGLTSRVVIAAENNGAYSHVGIVVDSAGVKMIVHAVPGEPDFEGDEDRVKKESPEKFFSSVNAECGEVCRHVDSLAAKRAAAVALSIYKRHTLFDHDYNETDTTKMYCTQLVTHSYMRAGVPFNNLEREKVDFLVLHTNCVLPTGLLESDQLYSVYKF